MKKFCRVTIATIIIVFFFGATQFVHAQKHDPKKDSLKQIAIKDSITKALADTVVPKIVNKIETYSFTLSRSSNYFKRRMDTTKIATALPSLEKSLSFFKKRIDRNDAEMNLRNLNTFSIMLQESANKLADWQTNLNEYSEILTKNNHEVKKIINDASLKITLPDTALNRQVKNVLRKAELLDSVQIAAMTRINVMKNKLSINSLQVSDMLSELNYRTIAFKSAMWGQEEAPLLKLKTSNYKQSLWEVVISTVQRASHVFSIYTSGSWNIRSINYVILAAFLVWCLLNYKRVSNYKDAKTIMSNLHFINHSVIASCITAFLCVGPYLYPNPPMVYMHANEVIRLIFVTYLLLPFFTGKTKLNWFIMLALWFFFAIDDLFIESSFGERLWLLFGSLALTGVCIKILRDKSSMFNQIEESPVKKAITILTLILAALSIFFNFTGRVTLAKILGMTAVQSFTFTFTLMAFSTIILEAVYLQCEVFRKSRFSDLINYNDLKVKLRKLLLIVTCILWVIAFSRSLAIYDFMVNALSSFFNKQRAIGNMQFSFMSVAIFVLIIWISSIISQFINFFFGSKLHNNTNKRSNLGSVMLLVRLAIWAFGFLVAIAAAGIPLDKISIMIGALSVGIGFGLQNIVNNLVSGIILAFERPIQIGDFIEVDGRSGTVKEIGVRSSKISNVEGADIIVPNGDMLSKHLINWTLHNRNKRLEIGVGVAYDVDVRKAKQIVQDILSRNEMVMKSPEPLVLLNNFGNSSVDFRILFWTHDLNNGGSVRSSLMMEIFEQFEKAGIEIPYPKTDVYIKQVEN